MPSTDIERLSARVRNLPPSSTLAVTAKVKAMTAAGHDVIGFGAGEPDFPTPEHIRQAAIDALNAGMTHYAPVPGDMKAREAVARKLREENGVDCAATDVVISAGAKHSLYLAVQAIVDPGRRVILPTPAWVSYRPIVELAGGIVDEVPGAIEHDFKITPEQLEAAIRPETVAVIFNSPSNPCGTMYTPDEFRALADVLARHEHVTIISDEIYEKLIYTDAAHLSPGSLPALADRTITVNGLSKAYAMTGWRIGYLAAPGAGGVVAKAVGTMQSQMTSNITSFVYPAIVRALEHGAPDVERMRRAFAARATVIRDEVGAWPRTVCPAPTGAFYVFPDMRAHLGRTTAGGRRLTDASTIADALLEEARVAVVPGEDFGACAATHVRLSFACAEATIREGCGRIRAWLEALS